MPLEKTRQVDAIGINKQSGTVDLAIIDGWDWEDPENHLLMLQEKMNSYLAFIESGEIHEVFPESMGRDITIIVYSKYPLPSEAHYFMARAAEIIAGAGFSLQCLVRNNENSGQASRWRRVV
jgi:hypothetical protein